MADTVDVSGVHEIGCGRGFEYRVPPGLVARLAK